MQTYPNLLLISGTGRNTGKTTMACKLINNFRNINPIAIKITSHFHNQESYLPIQEEEGKYQIFEEKDSNTGKDSSMMLKSGALKVFYIQMKKEYQYQAFLEIIKMIGSDCPVICESGGLRSHLVPGLHILMGDINESKEADFLKYLPDISIDINKNELTGSFLEDVYKNIAFENGVWRKVS